MSVGKSKPEYNDGIHGLGTVGWKNNDKYSPIPFFSEPQINPFYDRSPEAMEFNRKSAERAAAQQRNGKVNLPKSQQPRQASSPPRQAPAPSFSQRSQQATRRLQVQSQRGRPQVQSQRGRQVVQQRQSTVLPFRPEWIGGGVGLAVVVVGGIISYPVVIGVGCLILGVSVGSALKG